MPVIIIAPSDGIYEKTVSNMQEVAARGGRIILVSDQKGVDASGIADQRSIVMPAMGSTFTPIVYAVAVQFLAYHAALALGKDVDQPRNLAKSVTVE